MEVYLPIDSDKPTVRLSPLFRPSMAVLAKPMVDFPHGQTNTSKEKFPHVENDVPPLSSINLMRIGSNGRNNRGQSNGRFTNDNKLGREYAIQEASPSISSYKKHQPHDQVMQERDGSPGAFIVANERRGVLQLLSEEVRGEMLKQEVSKPVVDNCPPPMTQLMMNIMVWNCRGALSPKFS